MAYILALVVGGGSVALYTAAFFFPEVYRKGDFFWSGVGMFYALILWFCAGRITGALLLGQMAATLIGLWFAWQTLMLRRAQTPGAQQTQVTGDVKAQLVGGMSKLSQGMTSRFGPRNKSKDGASAASGTTGTIDVQEVSVAPETEVAAGQTPESETASQTARESVAASEETIPVPRDPEAPMAEASRDESDELAEAKEPPLAKAKEQKSKKFIGVGSLFTSLKSKLKPQPKPDTKPVAEVKTAPAADETTETVTPPVPASSPEAPQTTETVTPPVPASSPEAPQTTEMVTPPKPETAPVNNEVPIDDAPPEEETSANAAISESGDSEGAQAPELPSEDDKDKEN